MSDMVETACRGGYGKKWDDPVEGPREAMKNVWRKHVTKFLIPALQQVLPLIADEERRVTSPEAVGALFNLRNTIGAMMEEPTP